jgi:hypothetical protein
MTLITNFQEFEETNPLNGKITPALAESLADYFAGEQGVNEGMFDSIKNALSKTFLGSLSYLNMIDKVRSEVLKLEKESLQKKYAFEDEIDSLRNSIKELAKSKDEVGIERTNKTVDAKTKEYQSYGKMTNLRIEKAISTIKEAIKGNKRRMEYWEAGKSQDELSLAEFEYTIAKQRANSNPEDLKNLQEEIKKAKDEAEKSNKKLEDDAKNQKEKEKEKEKEDPSDYKKSLRTKKGMIEAIAKLEHELVDLQKELKNAKKEFDKKEIQIKIDSVKATIKNIENLERKNKGKELMKSQDLAISDELAKKVHDIIDNKLQTAKVKPIGSPIPGTRNASKETAKEKGKEKAEEVKKQETPSETSSKVNASLKNKK